MSAPTISNPSAVTSETNGTSLSLLLQQIQAKHDRLEQAVRELREQVAQLEGERDRLRIDRDGYRKQFNFLAAKYLPEPPPELTVTREEIEAAVAAGRDFHKLVNEIELEWG